MKKILAPILLFNLAFMMSCKKDKSIATDHLNNVNGSWTLKSEKRILTTGTIDTAIVKPGTIVKFTDSLYENYSNYALVSKGTFKLSIALSPKTNTKKQVIIFDKNPATEVFFDVVDDKLVYYNNELNADAGVLTFQKTTLNN
ncbi:hypothetical protein [Pedobacter sp. L105]|uniref:hypothetical protein n=1 Tax=Pedobacter sp. L105 TaxID=1641871 RepID=UPI00131B3887|nr:hypothetical protein [Pedobacter sp. L105]